MVGDIPQLLGLRPITDWNDIQEKEKQQETSNKVHYSNRAVT